mmetsp:Transcript_26938/g.77153  ORF Transcript_26938/g.77153 Transcript_26938/m.77153 type:complete len:237 (-) Transcript_26938:909-1619(-)
MSPERIRQRAAPKPLIELTEAPTLTQQHDDMFQVQLAMPLLHLIDRLKNIDFINLSKTHTNPASSSGSSMPLGCAGAHRRLTAGRAQTATFGNTARSGRNCARAAVHTAAGTAAAHETNGESPGCCPVASSCLSCCGGRAAPHCRAAHTAAGAVAEGVQSPGPASRGFSGETSAAPSSSAEPRCRAARGSPSPSASRCRQWVCGWAARSRALRRGCGTARSRGAAAPRSRRGAGSG